MIRLNQHKFKEEYTYYMLQALKEGKKEEFRQDFLDLHPTDQMEFFQSMDGGRRSKIYSFLSPVELGEIFSDLEPELQRKIVEELDRQYVSIPSAGVNL